jgi:hypothetical protein
VGDVDAEDVAEFADAVGFVDAGLRDIDGRRAAERDRKIG